MVSIVNFDSQPEAASPFTSDVSEWSYAIDHPDQGNSGAAILDSILFGVDLLKQRPAGNRRAILLISQEHDDGREAHLNVAIRTPGRDEYSDLQHDVLRGEDCDEAGVQRPCTSE